MVLDSNKKGKGTEEEFVKNYQKYIPEVQK